MAMLRLRSRTSRSESLFSAHTPVVERLNLAHPPGTVFISRPTSMVNMTVVVRTVAEHSLPWNIPLPVEEENPKPPTPPFLF